VAGVCGAASSPSQAEPPDDFLVSLGTLPVKVCEQAPTLADHLEQPTPAGTVVLRLAQVLGQMLDAFGEDRDLYLRRACVLLVLPEVGDRFALWSERHPSSFLGLSSLFLLG
jgi:hypothetical protein